MINGLNDTFISTMAPSKKIHLSFSTSAQIAFWALLFLFVLYVSSVSMGIGMALSRASLIFLCHLINFYVVFSFLTPNYFEKKKYFSFAAGVFLLILLLTPFRLWLEKGFVINSSLYATRKNIFGLVLFSEISIVAFSSLLRIAVNTNETKRKMVEMERLNLETELKFLKSQMSPHFLFNTINNVYSLSLSKSNKAPEALLKLSELLRYLLYECNHQVPLYKEVSALNSYIELFQLRYEEPLNILLISSIEKKEMSIEPMLLIPILENAEKHSAIGVAKNAFVLVKLNEESGVLTANFQNSKSTIINHDEEAGGIGLQNIRKRLSMLQLKDDALRISETETIFEVTLKIPVQ
jgi:sensor histidine kinase YesM